VLPVLGREVVERQQHVAIFDQLFDRPLVFDALGFNEQIEGDDGLLFCCRHPNVLQACLGLFMHWLGHSTRDVGHLVDPALMFFRRRVDIPLGAVHRMENPSRMPMVLIEVQTGVYLGEDDIIRYEDIYARA